MARSTNWNSNRRVAQTRRSSPGGSRYAEIRSQHLERDPPHQRIDDLEIAFRVRHDLFGELVDRRNEALGDIGRPHDLHQVGDVVAIDRRVVHAEDEREPAGDDADLGVPRNAKRLVVEEYFAHVVVARHQDDVAGNANNRGQGPRQAKAERMRFASQADSQAFGPVAGGRRGS